MSSSCAARRRPLVLKQMRDGLVIRDALPGDACKLSALATQVFLHTYATQGISSVIAGHVRSEFTLENFATWIGTETTHILVAEERAHLVGYARIAFGAACPERSASSVELVTLYVQEHFARQGVGSALLTRAQALAWQYTRQPLWLTVNAQNARAVTFYAAHLYTKIGTAWFALGADRHENHVLVAPEVPG